MEGLTSKKTDMPYEHEAYLSECLGADSISTRINTVSGIVSDRNSDGSSTTCYLYSSDNSQKGNFWLAVMLDEVPHHTSFEEWCENN